MSTYTTALLPIHEGDNFILKATNEHYVCLGWEHGYLQAGFHNERGFFVRSMTVTFLMHYGYVIFPSKEYDTWRAMRKNQEMLRAIEIVVWQNKQYPNSSGI